MGHIASASVKVDHEINLYKRCSPSDGSIYPTHSSSCDPLLTLAVQTVFMPPLDEPISSLWKHFSLFIWSEGANVQCQIERININVIHLHLSTWYRLASLQGNANSNPSSQERKRQSERKAGRWPPCVVHSWKMKLYSTHLKLKNQSMEISVWETVDRAQVGPRYPLPTQSPTHGRHVWKWNDHLYHSISLFSHPWLFPL